MTMTTTCTIALTGRAPVRISEDAWPVIARGADYHYFDGQYECQANRHTRGWLRVRQHADGRAIVYGVTSYETRWQHERGWETHAGVIVDAGCGIPAAVQLVWEQLRTEGITDDLAAECIADLPAEDLR